MTLNLNTARVMKTTTLLLSIALISWVSSASGQAAYQPEEQRAEIIQTRYSMDESGFVHQVNQFFQRMGGSGKQVPQGPVVIQSFVMLQPEIIYEDSYETESWMTSPFYSHILEADPSIEAWMIQPFGRLVAEERLLLEPWMTMPFGLDESIEIEPWMTERWY